MRLAGLIMIAVLAAGSAAADGREARRKGGSVKAAAAKETAVTPETAPVSMTSAHEDHQPNVYRFGATYSVLPGNGPAACESACRAETQCRAWSHVNAFIESPARCELKRATGKTEENLAATSGIVRKGTNYLEGATPVSPGALAGAPVVTTTRTYVSSSTASAATTPSPAVSVPAPAGTVVTSSTTIVTSVPTPLGSSPNITYTSPDTGAVLASSPTPLGTSPSVTYAPSTSVVTRYPVTSPAPATSAPAPAAGTYYPSTAAQGTVGSSSYYPERPRVLLPGAAAPKTATETPAQ